MADPGHSDCYSEDVLIASGSPIALAIFQEEALRAEIIALEHTGRANGSRLMARTINAAAADERGHNEACSAARRELQQQRESELQALEAQAAEIRLAREREQLRWQQEWEQREQKRRDEARAARERALRDEQRKREARILRELCQLEEARVRWRKQHRERFRGLFCALHEEEDTARGDIAAEDTEFRECREPEERRSAERSAMVREEAESRCALVQREERAAVETCAEVRAAVRSRESSERGELGRRQLRELLRTELREHHRVANELWQKAVDDNEADRREERRRCREIIAEDRRRERLVQRTRAQVCNSEEKLRQWQLDMLRHPQRQREQRQRSAERRRQQELAAERESAMVEQLQRVVAKVPRGGAVAYLRSAPPPSAGFAAIRERAARCRPADYTGSPPASTAAPRPLSAGDHNATLGSSALETTLAADSSVASPPHDGAADD
eukprot:TRINITY_DN2332_c0_g1_i2.p2 TRINITY_DN2332_c0_g1~~TRINITY_DN2332_c0_g1_i2.p2  ORF type:complete len:447 (+),score=136.83 TRINITY_DN2332_c0_g1_i2:86-1426(+)